MPDPYEFGPEDSRLIGELARKMRGVGSLTVLLGLFAAGYAGLQWGTRGFSAGLLAAVLTGVFLAATGAWSVSAGRAFQLVPDTQGHDLSHLMAALRRLNRLYGLHHAVALAFLAVLAFLVIFGLLAEPAH